MANVHEIRKIRDRHIRRIERMSDDSIMEPLRGLNRKDKAEAIRCMMINTMYSYGADLGPLLREGSGR